MSPTSRYRPPYSWYAAGLALVSLTFAQGCSAMRSDEYTLLWPAVAFLLSGIGGWLYIQGQRKRQMESWDLRSLPTTPSVIPMFRLLAIVVAVVAGLFTAYNFMLADTALIQKLKNSGLWVLGSAVGYLIAAFFGLQTAEPSSIEPKKEVKK